jgi:subtilisin-like proprotein convertase family protein
MPLQTLASLEGGPVKGTWALRVVDDASGGAETSRLDLWGLSVLTGKAYQEK